MRSLAWASRQLRYRGPGTPARPTPHIGPRQPFGVLANPTALLLAQTSGACPARARYEVGPRPALAGIIGGLQRKPVQAQDRCQLLDLDVTRVDRYRLAPIGLQFHPVSRLVRVVTQQTAVGEENNSRRCI